MRAGVVLILLLGLFGLSGCTTIRLISDYDSKIDDGATTFQKDMENHLAKLAGEVGTPAAGYSNYADFYRKVQVDLASLKTRAEVQPKNTRTVNMVQSLMDSLADLQTMHKEGLNANDLPPIRTAFNVEITAILKLELAKKRGDN